MSSVRCYILSCTYYSYRINSECPLGCNLTIILIWKYSLGKIVKISHDTRCAVLKHVGHLWKQSPGTMDWLCHLANTNTTHMSRVVLIVALISYQACTQHRIILQWFSATYVCICMLEHGDMRTELCHFLCNTHHTI